MREIFRNTAVTVTSEVLCHLVNCVSQRSKRILGGFRARHAFICWRTLWRSWFAFPAGLGTCPESLCSTGQPSHMTPTLQRMYEVQVQVRFMSILDSTSQKSCEVKQNIRNTRTKKYRWAEGHYHNNLDGITQVGLETSFFWLIDWFNI